MDRPALDCDDPAGRAQLAVDAFARRERSTHLASALGLFVLTGLGALLAVIADPAPTFGMILASLLFVGCSIAVWPWAWSGAEREHHAHAAIWAQVRPAAVQDVAWARYAAWANANQDHVELVLIQRAGSVDTAMSPSQFTLTVKRRLDPDAIADAAVAMQALREQAAELEARAHEQHLATVATAARKPYHDALHAVDDALRGAEPAADKHQGHAEIEMRHQLAEEHAAERRAQAAAVARALRRP
jgi:hypothetical protein